jgi:F-type H+-transporting ATPase subunit epsilon
VIALDIVTPQRRVLTLDVDEVVLPSVNGSMGVLEGHAPLLCRLDVGEMSYRVGDGRHYLAVSGGFAEILRHKVSILARTTEAAEEIDLERAKRAKEEAEEKVKTGASEEAFRRAEVRLRRAVCRIKVHARTSN